MADDIQERLDDYLVIAHSIEEQSLAQLERAPRVAGESALARALEDHRPETEVHERRVRGILEERGGSPSRAMDAVMRAGGKGFVLFAQAQASTPGKLAAHALSYEAFEWATHDLLARTAERAGEHAAADAARAIRDEEARMMERIESLFDRTADASLESGRERGLCERLRTYLADAHAIEAQSLQLLTSGKDAVDSRALARIMGEHLEETRRHQILLEDRLEALDGEPSRLKDAALRIGALNWGMFFQAQPDTTAKLAAFAYAFEYLEIGGYEQLRRVAFRARDTDTVVTAEEILAEERRAAGELAGAFEEALDAVLATSPP